MCTIWGFHFIVIKTTVTSVPPMFYAAVRMVLVALLLAPWLRWRRGKMAVVLTAGLCFGAINYAFLFSGLQHATASASAVAVELYTPFATILSVLFLGERVGWRRISGIAIAFAGVALIALARDGGAGSGRVGLGVALVVAGTFSEAIGSILVKRAQGFKPWELLAWFAVVGASVLSLASWTLEDGQFEAVRAADPLMLAGAIVYSAVFASIFGHTAYYWLLQRLPVSQVAPSALLTTILAVSFSIAFLGEPMTTRFLIGGAMALSGVAIVLLRTPKGRIVEPGAPEPVVVAPEESR
jgi:O-acetylserine/cysteine efflux transporter